MDELIKQLGEIKGNVLFGDVGDGLGPSSEPFYLMAIGSIDQAIQYLKLARLHLDREEQENDAIVAEMISRLPQGEGPR